VDLNSADNICALRERMGKTNGEKSFSGCTEERGAQISTYIKKNELK
jgi:hypothetical protein